MDVAEPPTWLGKPMFLKLVLLRQSLWRHPKLSIWMSQPLNSCRPVFRPWCAAVFVMSFILLWVSGPSKTNGVIECFIYPYYTHYIALFFIVRNWYPFFCVLGRPEWLQEGCSTFQRSPLPGTSILGLEIPSTPTTDHSDYRRDRISDPWTGRLTVSNTVHSLSIPPLYVEVS